MAALCRRQDNAVDGSVHLLQYLGGVVAYADSGGRLMQKGAPVQHIPSGRETCDSILVNTDVQLSMGGCIGGLTVLLLVLHCTSFYALTRQTKRS